MMFRWLLPVLLVISTSSCSLFLADTKLKITNNTGSNVAEIRWNTTSFGNSQWVNGPYTFKGLRNQESDSKSVNSESGYIYFHFDTPYSHNEYRTANRVYASAGETTTFTFTSETMVVQTTASVSANSMAVPLQSLMKY